MQSHTRTPGRLAETETETNMPSSYTRGVLSLSLCDHSVNAHSGTDTNTRIYVLCDTLTVTVDDCLCRRAIVHTHGSSHSHELAHIRAYEEMNVGTERHRHKTSQRKRD